MIFAKPSVTDKTVTGVSDVRLSLIIPLVEGVLRTLKVPEESFTYLTADET